MSPDILEQALTKGLTPQQQKILFNAKIAIAGAGGLGSNVAVWLARAGVKHLLLIDFDKVEIGNLNRQYYFLDDVGKPKVIALKKHLQKINPYGDYQTVLTKITAANMEQLFADSQIICEALDNPKTKALLVNNILSNHPEKTIVASSGIAGLKTGNLIKTRQINKNFFLCGDEISDCINLPLCGARVGLCAAHQALTILRIILNLEEKQ